MQFSPLKLVAEKMQIVRAAPTSWKWVVLALQNAVQAAMVLALAGTDGCGALYPRSQKQNRTWLSNPTSERPRLEMADFKTLLDRIQRSELMDGPIPQFAGDDLRNLERLNELRRQFAHYNPTGWGIEVQYILDIVPVATNLFEHLTTTQGRPRIHFEESQRQRMQRSILAIRAELSRPEGQCSN